MRVLVTGAQGKVGSFAAKAFDAAGHKVVGVDIASPAYGPQPAGTLPYLRADLTDFGAAIGAVHAARPDVIVHAAGIPGPGHDPAAAVFANNTLATYNIAEAVLHTGVARVVYISSETAPGFVTAERPFIPDYLPVDEAHPRRPQDPYALSKSLGEDICDALVARSDATAVSIRPSYVWAPRDYAHVLSPLQEHPDRHFNYWSYVDVEDLADLIVLAATASTAGHEVVYAAQPDNYVGRPFATLVAEVLGDAAPPLRELDQEDCAGIRTAKARTLLGWLPQRSWRQRLAAD